MEKNRQKGGFMKYIAHRFKQWLQEKNKFYIYEVQAATKSHQIWQRDSPGIEIYSRDVVKTKTQLYPL